MKPTLLLIAIGVLLMAFAFSPINLARSEPDQFIIDNADAVVYISTSPPGESITLNPRFIVEYANDLKYYNLSPIPIDFGPIDDRFVIQYANANRFYTLTYPVELIGDSFPPQISNLSANGSGLVHWDTDEYAACEVYYGIQSGIYPYTISDPLFYKSHQIKLINLTPGITYYYKVSCTDRSGNTAESVEQSFTASQIRQQYLPLVSR
jgi:hypothetical protein